MNAVFYVINSRDRVSGTDSAFSYKLQGYENKGWDKIALKKCSIPTSYYMVQSGKNTFTLTEENVNNATITITAGNYSRTQFINTLQSALNTGSPGGYTYSVSYPSTTTSVDTGKLTISCVGHTLQTKIIFVNYMWEQMGFNANSTNTFSGGSLVSVNCIKLLKEDVLLIHCDKVAGDARGGILAVILSNGQPYSSIIYEDINPDKSARDLVNPDSGLINIYITNEDNELMDFNGLNAVLEIMIFRTSPIIDILSRIDKILTYSILSE